MLVALPEPLAAALEAELAEVDPRRLRRLGEELSATYREGRIGGRRIVRDADTALAHAAWHLPQAHAALRFALAAVAERRPDWRPLSLLDLGAGPGTAAWAALGTWSSLETVTSVEREPELIALGRRLGEGSGVAAIEGATWRRESLESFAVGAAGRADLVVLAHVVSELAEGAVRGVVERAWKACADTLVVVEPGTPRGHEVVLGARDVLLGCGARTFAPCPHDAPCPLEDDWCHFAQRAERPHAQRRVKGASLPWEDAKLSYVAVSRSSEVQPAEARVIAPPRKPKGLVEIDLCTRHGLERRRIGKSRKGPHRVAAKLRWGEALDSLEPLDSTDSRGRES